MTDKPPQSTAAAPSGEGERLVLAYFELLRTWQEPLTVQTASGVEAEGLIEAVDPARNRLILAIRNAPQAGLEPDDQVSLYFGMEDGRWVGQSVVQHFRDNRRSFILTLPRRLEPRDRRKHARVHQTEGLSAQVRVSEFGGAAFHGPLLDLSEGGFQMRVDQTNEDLESESLGEGQELAIVRVTGLDGGELETSGRLVYLARGKAGLRVGIRFRNLRPEARSRLEAYLRPRVVEPPTTLPPLAYKPGGEEGVAETEGALAEARSETLLRLKKRGRTLVFAMPPGPDRERAQSFLQEQGFGRVLGVETLAELMEILEVLPIHAVIIDQGVTEMGGLELASFIHYAKAEGPCRILLVEDQAHPSRESLVRRAGVDRVLLRPYLGMGLVTALEEELELRPRQVPQEVLETSAPSAGKSRVIRRFRGVALVMPPGPDREALGAFLAREGFTRVVPAGTIAELVRTLDSSALALLFIDWPDPDVQELEIAHFLESVRFEGKVQLLLASSKPSPRMVGDAKALGVAHVLVKPYALDGALADLLTGYLGDGGE